MEGKPVGRRVVLGMMGTGLAGIVFGSKAADLLERVVAPIASRDGTGFLSLFPVGRFRIYTVTGRLHSRSDADYRLNVGGFVDSPVTLTLEELRAMPATRMTKDFQCVTGWRVHDVKWAGVRLSDLLDKAGVKDGAQGVRFVSFDGAYTETLTMDQARRDDVIVAYEMEGKPVTAAHGGPARFDDDDRRWLRSLGRAKDIRIGKFHPGQKLNAAFTVGAIVVMLATGSIMHWFRFFPVDWRTGATFVHDWLAIVLTVVIVGHLKMAMSDGDARRGMSQGWVPTIWARRHRPKWYEEMTGHAASPGRGGPPTD